MTQRPLTPEEIEALKPHTDPTVPTELEALLMYRTKPRQRGDSEAAPIDRKRHPNLQLLPDEWGARFKRWMGRFNPGHGK